MSLSVTKFAMRSKAASSSVSALMRGGEETGVPPLSLGSRAELGSAGLVDRVADAGTTEGKA